MSRKRKPYNLTPEGRERVSSIISEANRKRVWTEESKRKSSETHRRQYSDYKFRVDHIPSLTEVRIIRRKARARKFKEQINLGGSYES